MSRLKLLPTYQGLPDGHRFTVPATGHVIRATNTYDWMNAIRKYYKDNGLPIPDDMQAIAENQLCMFLPPGWCAYEDGSVPTDFINTRLDLDAVERGSNVLMKFVEEALLTGSIPLVSKEVAEARGAICAACPANVGIQGCRACKVLGKLVDFLGRASKTKADSQLEGRSCAICGCSSRLQIHLPIEILAKGVSPEQRTRFDRIEHCWKAKSLHELETVPT